MKATWLRIGLYAAVAIVAIFGGYTVHRATVGSTPAASAPAPAAHDPPKELVETVPEFSLHDRAGELKSIRAWQGKSLVINFWATWCGPCRREIPLLKQLEAERSKAGFQIIGVAVDRREDVLQFADEMKMDYPILIGEQDALSAAESFGIQVLGFPFTVFSDAKGRVVTVHLGELTSPQAKAIFDAIERVNRGELTPTQARAVAAEQLVQDDANPS
jgi:thiol-disulfide isomerase/thioredoxin